MQTTITLTADDIKEAITQFLLNKNYKVNRIDLSALHEPVTVDAEPYISTSPYTPR